MNSITAYIDASTLCHGAGPLVEANVALATGVKCRRRISLVFYTGSKFRAAYEIPIHIYQNILPPCSPLKYSYAIKNFLLASLATNKEFFFSLRSQNLNSILENTTL